MIKLTAKTTTPPDDGADHNGDELVAKGELSRAVQRHTLPGIATGSDSGVDKIHKKLQVDEEIQLPDRRMF